jgi:hypothetical protein
MEDGGFAGGLGGADVGCDGRGALGVDYEHRQPSVVAVSLTREGVQQQAHQHQQQQQADSPTEQAAARRRSGDPAGTRDGPQHPSHQQPGEYQQQ